MEQLSQLIKDPKMRPFLWMGYFGVEKEGQRILEDGELANTPFPEVFGSRSYSPYIQTDFSENQLELITPVTKSPEELLNWLHALHDVTYRSIPSEQSMYPLSLPPNLPVNPVDIQIAHLENHADVLYRRYLAKTYGKRRQMICGIHFNFNFGNEFMNTLFNLQTKYSDFKAFKNELYLKLARNYLRYQWLITYFFGASPVSNKNYFGPQNPKIKEPCRSIRNSKYGYANHDDVWVSYCSLDCYIRDIVNLVKEGKIIEQKEFYAPVRFKGVNDVQELATKGIKYLEFRNFDLNPFDPMSITKEQINFLHLFMLFLIMQQEPTDLAQMTFKGRQMNDMVALQEPTEQTPYLQEGLAVLAVMESLIVELDLPLEKGFTKQFEDLLHHPEKTLSARLLAKAQAKGQNKWATAKGFANKKASFLKPYQLQGFTDLELSTQILMFDAIQKGIEVQVLDAHDQFLRLKHKKHVEYVKNANMTSKDNYIVPLIMENKVVTKKVLADAGFKVPFGREFDNVDEALRSYAEFKNGPFVVKPKSTNYGLGISIFKEQPTEADFKDALQYAFGEDKTVLVEKFQPGTEYRFFVMNNKVQGIILRTPANIVGDGKHTIKELVEIKNQDPLRGTHYRSPLEKIKLGEIEKLMLKEQGYSVDDVLSAGEKVNLRENSNVSTGGDSLDYTDEIPHEYQKMAVDAANALGAAVVGLDIIIPDILAPVDSEGAYSIIEANFNPAMHMHAYPYKGKSRRITLEVLKMLFPELNL